jgi:MFS superfamily sulfate permease-like transporter
MKKPVPVISELPSLSLVVILTTAFSVLLTKSVKLIWEKDVTLIAIKTENKNVFFMVWEFNLGTLTNLVKRAVALALLLLHVGLI